MNQSLNSTYCKKAFIIFVLFFPYYLNANLSCTTLFDTPQTKSKNFDTKALRAFDDVIQELAGPNLPEAKLKILRAKGLDITTESIQPNLPLARFFDPASLPNRTNATYHRIYGGKTWLGKAAKDLEKENIMLFLDLHRPVGGSTLQLVNSQRVAIVLNPAEIIDPNSSTFQHELIHARNLIDREKKPETKITLLSREARIGLALQLVGYAKFLTSDEIEAQSVSFDVLRKLYLEAQKQNNVQHQRIYGKSLIESYELLSKIFQVTLGRLKFLIQRVENNEASQFTMYEDRLIVLEDPKSKDPSVKISFYMPRTIDLSGFSLSSYNAELFYKVTPQIKEEMLKQLNKRVVDIESQQPSIEERRKIFTELLLLYTE